MPPNPQIVSIKFINDSKGWTFDQYPGGQNGIWDCRTSGQDKGHWEVKIRNNGSAGCCRVAILTYPTPAEYDRWQGDLAAGEEKTWDTMQFLSGSWSSPGWSNFRIRCQDCSQTPFPETDSKIVYIECFTGFRITAFYNGTQVEASGTIVETGQTFNTPLSGRVWVHVGADNHGVDFTIECTYGGTTLSDVATALREITVVEFHFGVVPTKPDIRIESIVMIDVAPDGTRTEYKVYPEGETPYITFGGHRGFRVTIKNYGGDAEQAYFNGRIKDVLAADEAWTETSPPTYNGEQEAFMAYIDAGYCYQPYCGTKTETDRKEFMIGYQLTDTFPSPPDRWCETAVSLAEGSWCCGLALDTVIKVVGNASVRYDFGAGNKSFYWYMINGVINCNQYPWLLFHIKCSDPSKIGYVYVVRLVDDTGKQALVDAVLHTADWELKVFPVGEANQMYWGHNAGFNWNRVVRVEFMFQSNGAGSMWIDQMYFRIAPAIARSVFIKVVDKATGAALPNITCRLGDYIDSVKFVYGGYMDKTNNAGNAQISNIPYEPGGPASYYIFAEDPAQQYVHRPEDDVVVHLEEGDASITIKMTKEEAPPPKLLAFVVALALMAAAGILIIRR